MAITLNFEQVEMADKRPNAIVRSSELTRGGTLTEAELQRVQDILERGGFAIVPSDTAYSLSAMPTDKRIARMINEVLRRDEDPISLAFDGVPMVREWTDLPLRAARLLEAFAPGPITVVVRAHDDIGASILENSLTAPEGTVGVRIPDSQIERQLVTRLRFPLTTVAIRRPGKALVRELDEAVQIVGAGIGRLATKLKPIFVAIESPLPFVDKHSTVVQVPGPQGETFSIVREGFIPLSDVESAIGRISSYEVRDWT